MVYYGILWYIMVYYSILTIRDPQNQIGNEFGFIYYVQGFGSCVLNLVAVSRIESTFPQGTFKKKGVVFAAATQF